MHRKGRTPLAWPQAWTSLGGCLPAGLLAFALLAWAAPGMAQAQRHAPMAGAAGATTATATAAASPLSPCARATRGEDSAQIAALKAGRFSRLDAQLGAAQAAWKAGRIDDVALLMAFRPFRDADPALEARYAAWVAASPQSYAARLAQGLYEVQVGRVARGCGYYGQTSESQLRAMDASNALARQALRESLALDNRPLMSYMLLIDISRHHDDDDPVALLAEANRVAPRNFIARRKYMSTISTRWGGSTARMAAFLEDCRAAGLEPAKFRALALLVERDRAWVASSMGDSEQAAAHGAAAIALAEDTRLVEDGVMSGLLQETGFAYEQLHRPERACEYLQRASLQDPTSAWTWAHLGSCRRSLGQFAASALAYQHGAELGDAYCQDELGKILWFGNPEVRQDRQAALMWLEHAAAAHYPEAVRNLALARKLARQESATGSDASASVGTH